MQSKTSFFNPTLFWKNLTRSWPLWGGVSAVGSLVPLFLLLVGMNQVRFDSVDFAEFLLSAATFFLPSFTFCYALVVAMFVWHYLHNTRAVGMMHSLGINRTALFVTNTLSGFAMLLIPYVIVGFLLCLVAAGCGAMNFGAVLQTVGAVLLENLLFFGIGTLCAMATGHVVATAVFYVIANFAVPVLDTLIQAMAEQFIFGMNAGSSEWSLWFSPLTSLYSRVQSVHVDKGPGLEYVVRLEGFWVILLYGAVGAALLALSWWLCRIRHSESAGDVVAFSWLRPVFRYGIAFVSSLTLGRVLYEIFWSLLFYDGTYDLIPLCGWMMISAVVGYYVASMLLEKTLRVFRGSLKKVALVCAAVILLCTAMAFDLFGIEKYVPNADQVTSVRLYGFADITCNEETLPDLIDDICALHESIVADRAYIKSADSVNCDWRTVTIRYSLRSGREVERQYLLPLDPVRTQEPDSYVGRLYALVTDPDVLLEYISIPESGRLQSASFEHYMPEEGAWGSAVLSETQWATVYAALCQDAKERNFMLGDSYLIQWKDGYMEGDYFYGEPVLHAQYRITNKNQRDEWGTYTYLYLPLQPTMVHTLSAMKSMGLVTDDEIASWLVSGKY